VKAYAEAGSPDGPEVPLPLDDAATLEALYDLIKLALAVTSHDIA
jgi:hypothetical protein